MNYLMYLLLFILGISIGSFLNVLIDSLPFDKDFVNRRSVCDHCKKVLSFYDLIPVFSYLFLLGKCRFCGKKINVQYPLVEFSTGILFSLSFLYFFNGAFGSMSFMTVLTYILFLIITAFSILIFMIDLKYGLVLDVISYPAIFLAFCYTVLNNLNSPRILFDNLLGAFLAGFFFWFLVKITKGKGMGEGDIFIAIFIGLLTGFPAIFIALLIAFLTGAFVGVILIMLRKKKMKSEIAFGPFLIIGAYLSIIIFGNVNYFWTFPLVN